MLTFSRYSAHGTVLHAPYIYATNYTDLICCKNIDNINSIIAEKALGATLVRLHCSGTLDEGVEKLLVLNAEPLPQIAKH